MTRNPYGCNLCGMTFRTAIAEARHRHNAPTMCSRKGLKRIGIYKAPTTDTVRTRLPEDSPTMDIPTATQVMEELDHTRRL